MQSMAIALVLFVFFFIDIVAWFSDTNRELETKLFKNYNKKYRPVIKDTTTMQVRVFMSISHVEEVNEQEQTIKLHGQLWAQWKDEHLTWDPAGYNYTRAISVDPWKLWQPALALYNSAQSNGWNLYFQGLPASVGSDGKVWMQGAFSFYVTCLFDFSRYPYDQQECPIVIADWVYDLSRVNLSDPIADAYFSKPSVRLSYDPANPSAKKFVSGWEITDTWRKHCYWGPAGCKDEAPDEQPEWYWSLIEFGIKLRRHEPYFAFTVIIPTILTALLTLSAFWIDSHSLVLAMLVFSILLQGLFGWELIHKLPPGSGSVPRIVSCYGFNLSLALIAFIIHIILQYVEFAVPEDVELPFQLTNVTERLRSFRPFKLKGLYFDTQKLLNGDLEEPELTMDSPMTTEITENHEMAAVIENHTKHLSESSPSPSSASSNVKLADQHQHDGHFAQQLYVFRRILFFLYVIMYLITLPICLL